MMNQVINSAYKNYKTATEEVSLSIVIKFLRVETSFSNKVPGNEGRNFGIPTIDECFLWDVEKHSLT